MSAFATPKVRNISNTIVHQEDALRQCKKTAGDQQITELKINICFINKIIHP